VGFTPLKNESHLTCPLGLAKYLLLLSLHVVIVILEILVDLINS